MLKASLTLAAVAAASVLLAACGGSDPSSTASEQAREQQSEAKLADFAKCMREHGVNAEVATMPGGGHGLKVSPGTGGPGAMEGAQNACKRYAPEQKNVHLSPQQKVEVEESLQKFARCMREHGIKVITSTKGGGIQIGIHHTPSNGEPNPESPAFQEAQSTCQKLLPKPPGAAGKPTLPPGKGGAHGGEGGLTLGPGGGPGG